MERVEPKWRRRKADRPAEIAEAALAEFAEKGFAHARLEEIARRAGISKAALYRYFDTKEALFRAVAATLIAPRVAAFHIGLQTADEPFAQVFPTLLANIAHFAGEGRLPAVIRLVIGESRAFPDLAGIWHDTVVLPLIEALEGLIVRAQRRGELVASDSRLLVFTLVGPLLMGTLFQEVFKACDGDRIDLEALAAQHAQIVIRGSASEPSAHQQSPRKDMT